MQILALEHSYNKYGFIKRERENPRTKSLVRGYREFYKLSPKNIFGIFSKRSNEALIDGVKNYIRKYY